MVGNVGEARGSTVSLAQESGKIRRAREKLEKRHRVIDGQVTVKELKRKGVEIKQWIARHGPDRVVLKKKNISLFDGNRNPADVSQRVSAFAKVLQKKSDL